MVNQPRRTTSSPLALTGIEEGVEFFGGEKDEKIKYTMEPVNEAEADSVPGSSSSREPSAKNPTRKVSKTKPGAKRSPTRSDTTSSSVSGFKFRNGSGNMYNNGVGNIQRD